MAFTFHQRGRVEQKRTTVLRFTARWILVTSLILLCIQAEVLFGVQHHWRNVITGICFGTGPYCLLTSYIAVRRISETGFTWLWLLSVVVSFASAALCFYSFYYLINHAA